MSVSGGTDRGAVSAMLIEEFLINQVARYARLPPDEIDPHAVFASFGLGSAAAVQLSGDLSEWLGREISPTLAWEHPTIAQASAHLAAHLAGLPPG